MRDTQEDLNYRMKHALYRGDLQECRELIAEGAGAPGSLTSCEQAEWLGSAINADQDSNKLLDLLLEAGLDANSLYDRIGEDAQSTPLTIAARAWRLDLMKRLAAAGANVHWQSPTGANAASETFPTLRIDGTRPDSPEFREVRQWLAEQGVRMNPACRDSQSKLWYASWDLLSWPDVPLLLEFGVNAASLKWTPFMMKIAMGSATTEDVTAMPCEELEHRDVRNRTPFLMAVTAGRRDLAEALIIAGCDTAVRGRLGNTALHLAADHDHTHLLEWLVGLGLAIETENDHQKTPLRVAVSAGNLQVAHKLLAMGANVMAGDKNNYRVIHVADSREMLELLLDAGAEVNDVSGGGSWPLKDACEPGNAELVKFLLQRGADPNLTSTGETAIFEAVKEDSLEIVELLLAAGADINAQDCDGWTCLFHLRSLPMARLLLKHGADPAIADQCGNLPEDWHGLPRTVSALLREYRLGKSAKT